MTPPQFGRVLTAMVTPFAPDGSIDFDVAIELAEHLVNGGSDGLVLAGSTGEGSALSDSEKLELFACVAGAVQVPVLAGTSSSDTARSVALTRLVQATGASGVLATTPPYARPSQDGIAAHLGAIAEATELPVMLYDIPSRTGRKIAAATTVTLVESYPNITALKDASGDLVSAAHVQAMLGDALDLYSGDDSMLLPFMAVGAVGLVSVASHWAGPEFAALVQCVVEGDWSEARRLNEVLAPSCAFENTEAYPNPMPTKAVLRALGINVGPCRLPHPVADAALDEGATALVATLRGARV